MEVPTPVVPLARRPARSVGDTTIQAGAVALVAAALLLVSLTTVSNLQARGIPVGFEFLGDRAGFKIADTVLAFTPDDTYLRAIAVAVGNTLFLSVLVCVAATVLGAPLGVARLSRNPLVSALAAGWVEAVRNTPPVLLLIFLYAFWSQALPAEAPREVLPGVLLSIRGLSVPKVSLEWSLPLLTLAVAASLGASLLVRRAAGRLGPRTAGRVTSGFVLALLGAWIVALGFMGGIAVEAPRIDGSAMIGGARLTPEFATVGLGLTLYTAGFIAEIVRSGLLSVPRGQWEAARALGLGEAQILLRIIAPQMLRVIVPPMASQYINTVKNSTLAIAVGYSEFMTVMGTVINRTNHALEGTIIIVAVYTAINLALAAALEAFNRHVQLPGR